MTFEDFLVSLNATAPTVSDKTLRLLLHLVARSIAKRTYTITASDMELSRAVGIGHGRIAEAKRQLAGIVGIETRHGCASTFRLPSDWFPLQQSLFSVLGDPETGSPVTPLRGYRQPQSGVTGNPGMGSGDPGTGLQQPRNGVTVTPEWGRVTPERGYSDPETGSPLTQNQQDSGALSNSISISEVSSEMKEYVFSILSKRHLLPTLRPAALALGQELQHALFTLGATDAAEKPPDDVVLAQCLSIAPLRELLPVLKQAAYRKGKPRGYAWFVTVFLENLKAIPREATKQVISELRAMRQAKPPGREETLPFPALMTQTATNNVKRLR